MALYLTVYPDERTCAIWAEVVDQCRRIGRRIQTADAWIASAAEMSGAQRPDHHRPRINRAILPAGTGDRVKTIPGENPHL